MVPMVRGYLFIDRTPLTIPFSWYHRSMATRDWLLERCHLSAASDPYADTFQSFWAPNAVTWGYDSRAASIRLITPPSCPPSATRMEVRVPGADMNPYFALAAIFQLGLRGVEKKLPIPVPPVKDLMGDRSKVVKLATGLDAATKLFMREGSVARETLGDDFVNHYGGTREHEVGLWNEAVTNWEGKQPNMLYTSPDATLVERYLELV